MVELTYLSLKKTTFFVRIFDISHCVFSQISIGRARWMRNLILHPTSTHTTFFWWTLLPQKKEIPEKMWWWCHHHVFSGISCFWGSRVRQKYAVWVLVGCGIKFRIQLITFFQVFLVFGVAGSIKSMQCGYSLDAESNSASNELSWSKFE